MKPKTIKTIAIIEGVILLFLLGIWGLNSIFDNFLVSCDGKLYASAPSPDKKFTAYAFERDCGATTDFASFVILRYGNEKPDLKANLDSKEIIFQTEGDYPPTLKWISKDTLQVSFPGGAPNSSEISYQTVKFWDYKIQYRGLPAP